MDVILLRRQFTTVLLLTSTAALALSYLVGGFARLATGIEAPAPSTPLRELAVQAALLLALASALVAPVTETVRIRRILPIAAFSLATLLVTNAIFAYQDVAWHRAFQILLGTLALIGGARAWATLTEREILLCTSPLTLLATASVATTLIGQSYLFPWYNTWGMIGVITIALAACLSSIATSVRLSMAAVGLLSVVLSTSRQAVLGVALITIIMLLNAPTVRYRLRALALLVGGAVAIWFGLSTNDRLNDVGGIASDNGRGYLLHSAFTVISESPWIGASRATLGGGTYDETMNAIGLGWSSSVHDFVFDAWLRGGVLAAVAATVFLIAIALPSGRQSKRGQAMGVGTLPFFLLGSQLLYIEDLVAALLLGCVYGVGLSAVYATGRPAAQS